MKKRWIIASVAVCTLATAGIVYSVHSNWIQSSNITSNQSGKTQGVVENVKSSQGKYRDGSFEGQAEGYGGLVKVRVTIVNEKISSIEIISHNETPGYYEKAEGIINSIVENNATNVDAIAGATITSDAIKNAVNDALNKALKNPKDDKKLATNLKSKSTNSVNHAAGNILQVGNTNIFAPKGNLKNGKYIGIGRGYGGNIKVEVTVKNNKIVNIRVLNHNEDFIYYEKGVKVIDKIVAKGNTKVDTISGATYSSRGIIEAVNNALKKAVIKPSKHHNKPHNKPHKPNKPIKPNKPNKPNRPSVPSIDDNENFGPELDNLYIKDEMKDGEYIGYGVGYQTSGRIKTTVTIKNGQVYKVLVANKKPEYGDDIDPFRDRAIYITKYLKGKNARKITAVSQLYSDYTGQIYSANNKYETAEKLIGKKYAKQLKNTDWNHVHRRTDAVSKAVREYIGDKYNTTEMFDAVSGATVSAQGIGKSVRDAMKKAVNDAKKDNDIKETIVSSPKDKIFYANKNKPLDLSKLKVTLIKKNGKITEVPVNEFKKYGIEMFEIETGTKISNKMSLDIFKEKPAIKVIVRHTNSITFDNFVIQIGNYSDDYINDMHYSLDGQNWYKVEKLVMDEKNPENISYRNQTIDAPTSYKYKNIKVRVVSKEGNYYQYTSDRVAGSGNEITYISEDNKGNNNVPNRLYIHFTFSGTEDDKIKVPDSSTEKPEKPEKPQPEPSKEIIVDDSVISTNYNNERDIVEGTDIYPISVTLHDKDAKLKTEIENLPKGMSFDGHQITGAPIVDENSWNLDYYNGLHQELTLRIKATKEDAVLVKELKIFIRRDKDKDGIADYNEADIPSKKDVFNAVLKSRVPMEVNGIAPTIDEYKAMIKNLPKSGVTVEISKKPDLSKIGKTEVELNFKVDGLSKIGKQIIKINVVKPVENTEILPEIVVDDSVISTNYNNERDIVEGTDIYPISVTLHDKDVKLKTEIENLPKGMSFDGHQITGAPIVDENSWNLDYYNGLHQELTLRIKATKEDAVLVKELKIFIRRDKDKDGIADYNEADIPSKKDVFNAVLKSRVPMEVNGVAPTIDEYKSMIKNLPKSGVTVEISKKPDLSKIGKTEVELSFKVDGLSKIGKQIIKINVVKPVVN